MIQQYLLGALAGGVVTALVALVGAPAGEHQDDAPAALPKQIVRMETLTQANARNSELIGMQEQAKAGARIACSRSCATS